MTTRDTRAARPMPYMPDPAYLAGKDVGLLSCAYPYQRAALILGLIEAIEEETAKSATAREGKKDE